MSSLNELANRAKREILAGDNSHANAEVHYGNAGRALTAAKKEVGHGGWLKWLRNNMQISERRARELMEIGAKKKNVTQVRKRKQQSVQKTRAKSALRSADLKPDACDYDWSNVKEGDFGNPSRAYKAQSEHYRREALHLAEAYPLRSNKIDIKFITEKEIQAVREVARAWSDLAETLTQRKTKEALCA